MLWQLFLKHTHTQSHADTHTDPDGGISWGMSMGASAVLRANVTSWLWEGSDRDTEFYRDVERERARERDNQSQSDMKQWGWWRDKQLTSLFQKDQPVGKVTMQVCMGGYRGEGMQRTWSETGPGWDRRERPINAPQESTAAPIPVQVLLLTHRFYIPSGITSWISPSNIPGTVGLSHVDSLTSPWQNLLLIGHYSGPCPGPSPGCVLRSCVGSIGPTMDTVR